MKSYDAISDAAPESDDEGSENKEASSIRAHWRPLLPQMIVGFLDAVAFMVVAPSLFFYVSENGGTKEQYGIILATFSFSSFLFQPLLAHWCDSIRRFRPPYLSAIAVSGLGGLVYFGASAVRGPTAVALILLGRFLGGCGAASATLGFSYVALVVPKQHLTQANALLSMVRVTGIATAPVLSSLLAWVNVPVTLGHRAWVVDPLNSVGLLLAFGNVLAFVCFDRLFEEPAEQFKSVPAADRGAARGWSFARSLCQLDVLLPLLSMFVLNANYQLLETGLAPAAHDVLGWDTVRISALFGVNAVVVFGVFFVTFSLSGRGIQDLTLMRFGLVLSIVAYFFMYIWWRRGANVWMFVSPVVAACTVFPFLTSPTRSLYTRVVTNHPHLHRHQATLQALLSMSVSVAGFVAPGLIAANVVRLPEEVQASGDQRELTPWALVAPAMSAVVLVSVAFCKESSPPPEKETDAAKSQVDRHSFLDERDVEEQLSLLTGLYLPETQTFYAAARRHTITVMGIPSLDRKCTGHPEWSLERHTLAW